jgi:VCBS repeat-containing protein
MSIESVSRRELFVIDSGLANWETLLEAVPQDARVLVVEPERPGLQAILDELTANGSVDALHILSHGSEGSFTLGSTTVDADYLPQASDLLGEIGANLADDADILLYGCDTGAGTAGQSFVSQFAQLTGADVAASDDITGAGGDWQLELVNGLIETDSLEVEHYAASFAAPTINNLDASVTFTEGGAPAVIDSNISFSGGSSYGGGYVEYALSSSNANDQLTLASAGDPNASGAISIDAGTVYLGNGSGKDVIGSVDGQNDGTNGNPLRINFTANFTNPSFEDAGGVTGWTIGKQFVNLGVTQINGWTSPNDPTNAPNSGGDNDVPQRASYYSQLSSDSSDGTTSLRLYSSMTTKYGYDVVHGPYAYSNTFEAAQGDVLYFDWRANAGSDAYDAFGYLLNTDTGATSIVLNQTGATPSATTSWATASVTVPTSGNYSFVFVAGTWDATGGLAAGGSLYIDNFKVFGNKVNDTVISNIAQQIEFQNTAEDSPDSRTLTVTAADGNGATRTATTTLNITQANDAPVMSGSSVLAAIDEDTAAPAGASVSSLFAARFSDVDSTYPATDSLAGIAVATNTADAVTEGSWQYSTDGGNNWYDIGVVASDNALLLSSSSLLRFMPVEHYNGTPAPLSVYGVDSSFSGSFAVGGGAQAYFDTTADDGTSAVSATAINLATSVTSVNDAPIFTSGANALTQTDTAAYDSPAVQSGTATASDVENDSFSFSVRGGTESGGTSTAVGTYGTLAIDTTTGDWTYTANPVALNALPVGATPTESFDLKVTDSHGDYTTQALTIDLTGANDTPVSVNQIPDQTFSGAGSWEYQLPANSITDAEGEALTYTVELLDGPGGNPLDPDAGGALNAGDLPAWLSFDENTRTFSGNPDATAVGTHYFRVTATDAAGATVADEFQLEVQNTAPVVANPLPRNYEVKNNPWSYQIPINTFYDEDGDTLTWEAYDSAGNPITAGTFVAEGDLGNTAGPLLFDAAKRTLFGDDSLPLPDNAIEIRVSDGNGGTASTWLSTFIGDGADDAPVVQTPIPDQIWDGEGSHSFQIPADTYYFDDNEPLDLTATLDNGDPLPGWLSFDAATGTFSGNPDLSVDGTSLDIRVTATNQFTPPQSVVDTFTLSLTNTNDSPTVATSIADQAHTGTGTWSYSVAGAFADVDVDNAVDTLTYSAVVLNDDGSTSALPGWLTFDSGTQTFSGNPTGGVPYLNLRVIGTDSDGATVSSDFTLSLQDVTNQAGVLDANNDATASIADGDPGDGISQNDVLTASVADLDGASGTVTYQWQTSSDGSTWTDIAGSRAQNQSFTLTQAEVGLEVRVQAFFNDDGGVFEMPVAPAVGPVFDVNDPGTVTISGSLSVDETLTATVADIDGVPSSISYQWQSSSDNSSFTNIAGATGREFTITDNEGDKYIRVVATYTDQQTNNETPFATTNKINPGALPPVATDDTGTAVEAGGVLNATVGSNATGSVVTNDTDGNNDQLTVESVRAGGLEGYGIAGVVGDSIQGNYGALTLNANGTYTYVVDENHPGVEALYDNTDTLTDYFNYTVNDGTGLTDTAVLAVTITGANDAPAILAVPTELPVQEDILTDLVFPATFAITDPDSPANEVFDLTLTVSQGKLWADSAAGITIANDGSSAVTLSGTRADLNTYLQGGNVGFLADKPHLNANDADGAVELAISMTDTDGNVTDVTGASPIDIVIEPINDVPTGAPTLDGIIEEGKFVYAITDDIADDDGLGSFSYQWYADDVAISGATKSFILLGQEQVFKAIRVEVSYTDEDGTREVISSESSAPVGAVNDVPNGRVTIAGSPVQGQQLSASNNISDDDGMGPVTYQWLRDGEIIDGATGSTYVLTQNDVGADVSVQANYEDGEGNQESVASSSLTVANLNDQPEGAVTISGTPDQGETLTASNDLTDADGLGEITYQWLRDGEIIGGATGDTYVLTQDDVDAEISVQASYVDGQGAEESANSSALTITNVNDAPEGTVVISGIGSEGEVLSASNDLSDEDGLGEISYQWLRNGEVIDGATGETYTLTQDDVDQVISVEASYTDGLGTPESVTSNELTINNTNDLPQGDVTISGTPSDGETLTASNDLTDADGMGEVTYQWLRNGEVIEGATGSTYLLTQDDVGADISVRASYTDGQGTPESVDSNAVAIGNTNDLPTGGVTISGTPAEGETLTASNDLADEDGMGDVTYQWLRDGEVIEGATGSTYQLGESDIGAEISVIASYTDGQGTEESATSNTLLIANVNDEPTGGVTISGTPSEGETLTASNDLDDADGMGDVTYQWLRDGQVIDGATGATYDLGSDDIGTEISVVASYTDGQGTLESVGSDALTVAGVNSAPEGAVTLSGFPVEGETLTASNTLSDADGMGEVTYQWLRDGEVIEGASGETYVVGAGDFGSEISVVALYTDGEGNEESVAGDAIEITGSFNQAPVFDTTATLSVDEDDVLEGTLLATDPDGDDLTFTLVDGPANGSITLSDSGAYVYTPDQDYNGSDSFVAQVSDGNGGETQATFTIGVSPVEDEPEVVGGAPDQIRTRLGQTSTVDLAGIFEDVDGDLLTYSYTIDPAGDLPEWITFNDDGSVIFTAPTEATNERVTLTLTAVDESGNSVSHDLEFVAIRVLTVDGMEVEQDASLNRTDLDIQPVPADRVEDPETENVTLADIPLFSPENPEQSETLVSIPQGVGISARSGNGPVSRDQAIGDLITYIKETTAEDDADRDELIGGGESFLGNLPDTENLMVSRITLTAGDQTPSEPIRITSRTNNADEGESATIPEAFVIDVRDLPSGTVIDLDGIEFAVIVGDATVTGGNGRNIVYGNEQNQVIVLGEDDDELYGGSGDDTVGSKGGDDKVFGEAGNDTVFGGAGEDLVHGGLDQDVATFEGNRDDYTILFNNASVTVVNNSDETDSDLVVNAETLRFDDQEISVVFDPVTETFAWLYGSILDRQADLGGIEFYVDRYLDEGIDLGGIAHEMLRSQEFTDLNNGVAFDQIATNEAMVETLYERLHDRASDSEGFSFWLGQLESGMSVEAVIDEFMTSQEMQVNGYITDTGWSFLI